MRFIRRAVLLTIAATTTRPVDTTGAYRSAERRRLGGPSAPGRKTSGVTVVHPRSGRGVVDLEP